MYQNGAIIFCGLTPDGERATNLRTLSVDRPPSLCGGLGIRGFVQVNNIGEFMRVRSLFVVLCFCVLSACSGEVGARSPEPAPGQTAERTTERTADETAALAAVQRFFDTMSAQDSAGARSVLDAEGDFVSVRWAEDGAAVVRRAPNSGYLSGLASQTDTYLERMWDSDVQVHGPIATVWTPYDFHINGKFSHCGVDAFQLLKTDAGWIITGGTYTVERTGCAASPLGSPVQ